MIVFAKLKSGILTKTYNKENMLQDYHHIIINYIMENTCNK